MGKSTSSSSFAPAEEDIHGLQLEHGLSKTNVIFVGRVKYIFVGRTSDFGLFFLCTVNESCSTTPPVLHTTDELQYILRKVATETVCRAQQSPEHLVVTRRLSEMPKWSTRRG